MTASPKPRNTFRRSACWDALADGPLLLPELRWKVWSTEFASGKTKLVCARSTNYRLSFDRSLERWRNLGLLNLGDAEEDQYPVTYGMAARFAIFTLLERGQLSAAKPEGYFCVYFSPNWCAVVVNCGEGLAVNAGAIPLGATESYTVVSNTSIDSDITLSASLSEATWPLFSAETGKRVDPDEIFSRPAKTAKACQPPKDTPEVEILAKEGVALNVSRMWSRGRSS